MERNFFLESISKCNTFTENGALSNSSTGSFFADAFATAPTYRNREYATVCSDQALLWETNPLLSIRFIFYLRMITRKTKINDNFVTEKVQNGQGVRDEVYKRLLWVAENHPNVFEKNIWLLPIVGSWKDVWMLMWYDYVLKLNVVNEVVMFQLLASGLEVKEQTDLIRKYMPIVKSKSLVKTEFTQFMNEKAKSFAKFLGIGVKRYNKLKSKGAAHVFQQLISQGKFDELKWNAIPGRALNNLVMSKFLGNHDLIDSYTEWMKSQPTVKYTGYAYELGKQVNQSPRNMSIHKRITINKQFDSLIEQAKQDGVITGNVWCAIDTSGSMTCRVNDNTTAYDVCTSLGVFFSTLNQGAFHKHVIMFDTTSHIKRLSGDFYDMMSQIPRNAMGSTNFMSVVREIVRVRRENPTIPLEDYPKTLLVVSDMQFNPANNWREKGDIQTNYQAMKEMLYENFPREFVDEMKFIWWNVSDRLNNFPSTISDGGTYLFGGFDGSVITMLLGGEEQKDEKKAVKKSMQDVVNEALNQEILSLVNL